MIEFILFVCGFILGLSIRQRVLLTDEVSVKIKVDSKQAIKDMKEAQEAIKKLKKEMEW